MKRLILLILILSLVAASALAGVLSLIWYYHSAHEIGASKAMALDITYSAWAVLIGCAVALFVRAGLRIGPFEPLEKEPIDTLYGVAGMVRERREQFRPVFYRQLTVGIVLCVLAMIPIGLSLLFAGDNEFLHVLKKQTEEFNLDLRVILS